MNLKKGLKITLSLIILVIIIIIMGIFFTKENMANNFGDLQATTNNTSKKNSINKLKIALETAAAESYSNTYFTGAKLPSEQLLQRGLINTDDLLNISWVNNTNNPETYCAYIKLQNSKEGNFYIISPTQSKFLDKAPVNLAECT